MSSATRSPSGVKTRTFAYENFQGLDSSRDINSLDTGRDQHLITLDNCYCDWRGQVVREPGADYRGGKFPVTHITFFSSSEIAWVERTGSGLNFTSDRNHTLTDAYPNNAIISSTVFNQRVHIVSRLLTPYRYDGIRWAPNESPALNALKPAYMTSIQRRLAVAGISGKETQIHFSRVDQDQIFPDDEDPASENVLRAAYIDVANLLGTADSITGLGSFEQNRLIVFTADRALLYRIDPDISNWVLDDRANVNIGCISHNTIANAGTDVLFCSRSGVHSIRRSEDNGILVYSYSFSDKVDLLYRELFRSVQDPKTISAVFDQDEAQYHIFFPQAGGIITRRLTLSMNPEGGQPVPKFSTGSFINASCGAFLGGQLTFGTPGGVYNINKVEIISETTPTMTAVTPMLWHGSLSEIKETYSMIIQASGKGTLIVDAMDDKGRILGELVFEVDDTPDDNNFSDVALSRQYERKWEHRYRGAQYRFRSKAGGGLLRIIGFAVTVRQK